MKVKMDLAVGGDSTRWSCAVCGCTDNDCSRCIEETGAPCWWVAPSLCSACGGDLIGPEAFAELGPIGDTPLGELGDPIMPSFLDGCMRSGMAEAVCSDCGRPWLTRPKTIGTRTELRHAILFQQRPEVPKLCPVCDPEHPGHQPGGATDRQRWVDFWRSLLVGVLRERGRPLLELMPARVWVEGIPLQLVECVVPLGGELYRWHVQGLDGFPNQPSWPPATFAKGCRIRAFMPAGRLCCAFVRPTIQPDPERTHVYTVPFSPVAE